MSIIAKWREAVSALDSPLFERRFVIGVFLVYFLFQANAALHHGSWGQDFPVHVRWILNARSGPWAFSTHSADHPDPPLFHLLGAAVFAATKDRDPIETIAFVSLAANLFGLAMTYRLIRKVLESRPLRLACFTFIAFLPVIMIHALVLASDAFVLPLFITILNLLADLLESRFTRAFWPRILGICFLLLIGVETKYTFGSQAIALLGLLGVFSFLHLVDKRRAVQCWLSVGIAAAISLALILNVRGNFGLDLKAGEMYWTDVVFLHSKDLHILSAPSYSEPASGVVKFPWTFELLVPGRYSYPALVHLAIFTDILNIYQDDPTDDYFGQRTRQNRSRMRLAVKTGLIFSLLGLFLTFAAVTRASYFTIVARREEYILRFVLSLCGVGWFLNIVVFMPLARSAYLAGFWTPRLILPALLAFILLSFTELDRFVRFRSRRWPWLVLAIVMLQSFIHLSFLWPHGVARPLTIPGL